MLSGLCQAFAGCTAAALGADTFHFPALTVPGTEEYWCCRKAGTSYNPQNQYHWTKKWEQRNTSWTWPAWDSSAPVLSLFSSKATCSLSHLSGSDDIWVVQTRPARARHMSAVALGNQLPRPLTAPFWCPYKVNLSASLAICLAIPTALRLPEICAWAALILARLSSLKERSLAGPQYLFLT